VKHSENIDEPSGEPWRLRDLRGRDRVIAFTALGLALVPFAVALARAFHDGWVPSGDEANIATRSLDVFSRHPPLTGLPSTSSLYGDNVFTYHPGPFEFYLLAVPIRVLGRTTGPLLTAATVNASLVLIALWTIFRRAGLGVMLWAAVLAQAVMWSGGTAVLTDTLSSNMTMYPLLGTAVLAWAVADGDYRLLPLTAIVASYAAQQHLAGTLLVAILVVAATLTLAVDVVRRSRRGDTTVVRTIRPWLLAALAVAVICWAPPLLDELKGRPGNLTAIFKFARDNDRPTVGVRSAIDQIMNAVAPPTILIKTDSTGFTFVEKVGALRLAGGAIVAALLVAVVVTGFRRHRALARLSGVSLVLLFGALLTGSNVPMSTEISRVALFRWGWTAAFLTWTALGWALAVVVRDRLRRLPQFERTQLLAPVVFLVIAALVATATLMTRGHDDANRERPAFRIERRVASAVLDHIDHDEPVAVALYGHAAGSIGAHLIFRLVEAGVPIKLRKDDAVFLGRHREAPADHELPTLFVTSDKKPLPRLEGDKVVDETFDPEATKLIDDLGRVAEEGTFVLAPDADALIEREYPGRDRDFVDPLFSLLESDPRSAFVHPALVHMILEGAVQSPTFDEGKLRRLLELLPDRLTVLEDERLQVWLLTPKQLREALAERTSG
jgi:hypothetical protein